MMYFPTNEELFGTPESSKSQGSHGSVETWGYLQYLPFKLTALSAEPWEEEHLSSDRNPLVVCYMSGVILPRCIGILINHYKDPCEPIRIMECHNGFERCSFGLA